jgi:hypothetical protein
MEPFSLFAATPRLSSGVAFEAGGRAAPAVPGQASAEALATIHRRAAAARPDIASALAWTKTMSSVAGIPWQLAWTILQHEAGIGSPPRPGRRGSGFWHPDGVMQTTRGARAGILPTIPDQVLRALLGLPVEDATPAGRLRVLAENRFRTSLPVQVALGVYELRSGLSRFAGYVTLALVAYNTGPGWAAYIATGGRSKVRPRRTSDAQWASLCRAGAKLLHRRASDVHVIAGVWQCDKNLPGWFHHVAVLDRPGGLSLVGYKYLRSIRAPQCITKPTIICDSAMHGAGHRQPCPDGRTRVAPTRPGALDKLYQPRIMAAYYAIARADWQPVSDDGTLLRAVNGRLVQEAAGP